MQKTFTISAALAALIALESCAFAQSPPPPPVHHGLFGNLFHHNKPMPGTMPGHMMPGHMMPGHMMPGHMMPGHMMPGQHMMPGRPGMMGGMMPGRPGMMSMGGGVIGNKNTHVYHLPGDRGALPEMKNRVYFHSAAQAEAAGFHRTGGGNHMMMQPRMHGSPMHGTVMHHM